MITPSKPKKIFLFVVLIFYFNLTFAFDIVPNDSISKAIHKMNLDQCKDKNSVKESASQYLSILTGVFGNEEWQVVNKSDNEFSVTLVTNDSFRGEVNLRSRFPYDFTLKANQNRVTFNVKSTSNNNGIEIDLNHHLSGDIISEKRRKEIANQFQWALAWIRPLVISAFQKAAEDPHFEISTITFECNQDQSKVSVFATGNSSADEKLHRELLDVLKSNLKYVNYARSSVSFGCMMETKSSEGSIPPGEAYLINKLFASQKADGTNDDGRTTWKKVHPSSSDN